MASAIFSTFYLLSAFIVAVPGFLFIYGSQLPQFLQDCLLYGKARGRTRTWTIVQLMEIPKRWFLYFYIIGSVCNGVSVVYMVMSYMFDYNVHPEVSYVIDYVSQPKSLATGASSAILLVGMMFIQNIRRTLECIFVSVYSKSTMNIVHFALGIVLYSTFSLAVLSEAPTLQQTKVELYDFVTSRHLVGLTLFVYASYHHYESHVIFANLRKTKAGSVKTLEHQIPQGGWFKYVSCPHYFAECLIYLAFIVTVGPAHKTVWSIVVFVFANQAVAAYISHQWYKTTFRRYPKERYALVPYVF